jgi:tRNA 2-selenouridine synthase
MTEHTFYRTLEANQFWQLSKSQIVLDVRSPGEFQHGHLPGAINLPIFDDAQRAEIGTIYKNSGSESAVLRGLKFAGEKMTDLVTQARSAANGSKTVLVHCWRGGMRSQSVGWLLKTAGMEPSLLDGGYKSFRRYARESFDRPWNLQVISGLTGAGKTRVLHLLAEAGQQVLDLEGLANHRGSAFGGIGQAIQPSTEQFENELFRQLESFDPDQNIWLEDEGNRIGTVVIPNTFYDLMRHSPAVFMDSSPQQRVQNLLVDYGDLNTGELEVSINKIRKRLGPQHADEAITALKTNDVGRAIEIVLAYYDKTYLKAANAMPRNDMVSLSIDGLTDEQIVRQTISISEKIKLSRKQ